MDTLTALSIVALAGLIHASFQLSVSMATNLSGHAFGKKLAAKRTLRLLFSFLAGVLVMILLGVSFVSYIIGTLIPYSTSLWFGLAVGLLFVGLAVIVFYYRKTSGTELWISRGFAHFLQKRTAKATLSVEAFSLGLTSVIAELLFAIIPTFTAAAAIVSLPSQWQILTMIGYTIIASLGIIITVALIGSGKHLSSIQRWREQNKQFLQFASGLGLIILGFYIYTTTLSTIFIASSRVGL